MAIALPLLVELFHSVDRAVQWLSGGQAESASAAPAGREGRGGRDSRAHGGTAEGEGSGAAQRLCMPSRTLATGVRQWSGPLRLHPARRSWRQPHASY